MAFDSKKSSYTLALTGALAALLVLLAVLQYRWLGQVSIGERQVLQTSLKNRTVDLQQQFNRELDRARSAFEIGPEALPNQVSGQLAERYAKWKATAPYPGLVKQVFLSVRADEENARLMRFNEETRQLEASDWSTSFPDVRERSEREQRPAEHVAETIPVLIQAVVERESREQAAGFVIIALDLEYIRQEFIPTLARLNLNANGILEYELTLVNRDNAIEAIYNTRLPSTDKDSPSRSNDETAARVNLRLGSIAVGGYKRELDAKSELEGKHSPIALSVTPVQMREMERRHELELKRNKERSHTLERHAEAFVRFSFREPTIGQLRESQERESWQLAVGYLPGSLDANVARARERNLAISFGILSLLAISIIIIIISARRAQRLARQQMDFVAGVSHEFRTPLAVIHAVSENLADGLITDRQQIEQCGVVIRNDVRRLAGMVEQVLEFAGAFRGKTLYQPQPVDLNELFEQVLARHPMLEPDKQWEIERQIQADLPAVLADPTALASAVRNIIDNAIKYSGAHRSWIGIKAHTEMSDSAQRIHVTIQDKGIGIPAAEVPYIFEPFYRGREVIAAQIHGNGLGLSLVKNIIEAHGGTITVTSTEGEGSSFTLSLPAAPEPHTRRAD